MTANDIKTEILSWLKNIPEGCWIPSAGERGVVTGLMNTALRLNGNMGEANTRRRMALAFIFRDLLNKPSSSEISAKILSEEMWYALISYAEPHKESEAGMWKAKDGFEEAMIKCWKEIESWENQMNKQLGWEA
jgi:hypothetical protein